MQRLHRPRRAHVALAATVFAAAFAAGGAALAASDIASADSAFLKQAAQNNSAEVAASELAKSQGTSPQVKSFAEHMVTDHTKAGEQLKTLAASKGVEVPNEPSVMQKGKAKMLGAMKGETFDKRYAAQMEKDHEDTVKLFQKASTDAKDPQIKAFATQTLPTLQQHWTMAKELKATTDAKK